MQSRGTAHTPLPQARRLHQSAGHKSHTSSLLLSQSGLRTPTANQPKFFPPITLVNTQNVSLTKIVDSSSLQRAETKYGLRIQFLAIVVVIHELWLNA